MAIAHANPNVGTSAGSLVASFSDTYDASGPGVKRTLTITVPVGGATVYVGGPGVSTTAYGFTIPGGQAAVLDLGATDVPYACVASGTQAVSLLCSGL